MKLSISAILILAAIAAIYFYASHTETSHTSQLPNTYAPQSLSEKQQIELSKGPSATIDSASQRSKEFIINDIEKAGNNYKIVIEYKTDSDAIIYYSILRKHSPSSDFELALTRNVSDLKWDKYPPINYEEARKLIIQSKKIDALSSYGQLNLMHFRGSQPFYMFGMSVDKIIFGVDAETGGIVTFDASSPTKDEMERNEIEESKKFLRKFNFMKNGLLEINRDAWNTLSEQEKKDMEMATEETNRLINNGKLKLDDDFNVIFDKR